MPSVDHTHFSDDKSFIYTHICTSPISWNIHSYIYVYIYHMYTCEKVEMYVGR